MEIEKEVRYKVENKAIEKIESMANVIIPKMRQVDLNFGYKGFDSLKEFGYICRVRQTPNKIWMEVKNRQNKDAFYETEIEIKSFKEGAKFFESLGMKPYLYMNRTREVLEYKGLKIFVDDIELIGKFIEIEYQNLQQPEKIIDEFLNNAKIEPIEQPLYGDIFKELLENDSNFREKFENSLNKYLEQC